MGVWEVCLMRVASPSSIEDKLRGGWDFLPQLSLASFALTKCCLPLLPSCDRFPHPLLPCLAAYFNDSQRQATKDAGNTVIPLHALSSCPFLYVHF